MAAGAPRKFPVPCETWLERKGEQPAQPTGAVRVFCQKEEQLHSALVEQEHGLKVLQDGFQGSSPSILLLPYQEATEESKGRHLPALEVKQGPDMAKKPKTAGARERVSKTLWLSSQQGTTASD